MTTSDPVNSTTNANSNGTAGSGCSGATDIGTYTSAIVSLVFGLLLLLTSCYIFLVLCISLHRFMKKQRKRTPSVNTTSILANSNSRLGLSMRFVATGVSMLCVVHFTMQTILIYYECCRSTLHIVEVLIYGVIIALSYVFFWLRQRVLYDAPTMRLFHTKLLRTLSWLSLALIIICSIAQTASALFVHEPNSPLWIYLSWLIGCIMVQGVLLSLFLYPLRKHSGARKTLIYEYERKRNSQKKPTRSLGAKDKYGFENGIRDSNIFTVTTAIGPKGSTSSIKRLALSSGNPLYHAARRCVICAMIVFASDIITAIFEILTCHKEWTSEGVQIFGDLLRNFNLIINAIFVVGSFATWRRMLLPDCIRRLFNKANCFQLKQSIHHKVLKKINYRRR